MTSNSARVTERQTTVGRPCSAWGQLCTFGDSELTNDYHQYEKHGSFWNREMQYIVYRSPPGPLQLCSKALSTRGVVSSSS
jgi:hypothetical protein